MRKKTTTFFDLFYKIMTILIILAGITYIIINLVYTEGFSSLSHSYSENKGEKLAFCLNKESVIHGFLDTPDQHDTKKMILLSKKSVSNIFYSKKFE